VLLPQLFVSDKKVEDDKDEKLDKTGDQKSAAELLTEQIKTVFGSLKKIENGPKWRLLFCNKERRSFQKKLKIAQRKLSEELNLQKVIQRQRMTTCAILSLLTGPQNFFCEKMARLTLNSDSDDSSGNSSQDDCTLMEINEVEDLGFVDKITWSKDRPDERLTKLFSFEKLKHFNKKSLKQLKRNKSQWKKIGSTMFEIEEKENDDDEEKVVGEISTRVPLAGTRNFLNNLQGLNQEVDEVEEEKEEKLDKQYGMRDS